MKIIIYSALLSLWIGYSFAQKNDTISLIEDPGFKHGLTLLRADPSLAGHIYPYGNQTGKPEPFWKLAEWGTGFYLTAADKRSYGERVSYANTGKRITFKRRKNGISFAMDVIASREYISARRLANPGHIY